jgi:hypothetical protein
MFVKRFLEPSISQSSYLIELTVMLNIINAAHRTPNDSTQATTQTVMARDVLG